MEYIMLDDADESLDNERKLERKFSLALDTEVENSSTNMIKDISEMITDALDLMLTATNDSGQF